MKVLVVDDDGGYLEMTEHIFSKEGAEVATARNTQEALDFILKTEGRFADQVVCDGLKGGWLQVRAVAQKRDVPFLLVTAEKEYVDQAKRENTRVVERLKFDGDFIRSEFFAAGNQKEVQR